MRVFQLIVAGAAARGVEPSDLLRAAGLTPQDLADPDGRLPRTAEQRLWNEAARLTGEEAFGVHLSRQLPVDGLGALGFAVRSSATVGEAYRRVMRYLRLLARGPVIELCERANRATLRHLPPTTGPAPTRHAVEFLMGNLVVLARHGVSPSVTPEEARFRHSAPSDPTAHRDVFGPGVRFDQDRDEISFDRSLLLQRQAHAEPSLSEVLDKHLGSQLLALSEEATFLDRVKSVLTDALKQGEPTLTSTAARLHMSPRTLQRRLREEGTSLSGALDHVRSSLAVHYLVDSDESIGEVAFVLGFSEVSTFHRAFKRWTGVTPASYRRGRVD